ncbi:MAG: hypothetical protein ACR2P2_08185 [Nakamurella sp.]
MSKIARVLDGAQVVAGVRHLQQVPGRSSQDESPDDNWTRPRRAGTVAFLGSLCSPNSAPAIMPTTVWRRIRSWPPTTVSAAGPVAMGRGEFELLRGQGVE